MIWPPGHKGAAPRTYTPARTRLSLRKPNLPHPPDPASSPVHLTHTLPSKLNVRKPVCIAAPPRFSCNRRSAPPLYLPKNPTQPQEKKTWGKYGMGLGPCSLARPDPAAGGVGRGYYDGQTSQRPPVLRTGPANARASSSRQQPNSLFHAASSVS